VSAWTEERAARIEADGHAMTPSYRDSIAAKFREEIGGVYLFVAARIVADHSEAS
jgi:hypothetical protein